MAKILFPTCLFRWNVALASMTVGDLDAPKVLLVGVEGLPLNSSSRGYSAMSGTDFGKIPTTVIAGVTVSDTPLIKAAVAYARAHSCDTTYNHVMRCWLFGSLIIQKTTPPDTIDQEVHSLSAILHDLGWDNTGEFISNDKRFEVDRAIAARNFIDEEVWNGRAHGWDEHRKQLVWDTIALHSTPSIAMYKQPVVGLVGAEIASDFQGPNSDPTGTLTWDEYHAVVKGFPRLDLAGGVRKIICGFIDTKPNTTIGNGCNHMVVKFRADTYTVMGRSAFEMIEAALK